RRRARDSNMIAGRTGPILGLPEDRVLLAPDLFDPAVDAPIDGTGVAIRANAEDAIGLMGTADNVANDLVVSPGTHGWPVGPERTGRRSVPRPITMSTTTWPPRADLGRGPATEADPRSSRALAAC